MIKKRLKANMLKLEEMAKKEEKEDKEHLTHVVPKTNDVTINLNELRKLSKREFVGFKVIGDEKEFTIRENSYNILLFLILLIFLFAFVMLSFMYWFNEYILIFSIIAFCYILYFSAKKLPEKDITVNTIEKTIVIRHNNFISKHFNPIIKIPVNHFVKITSETARHNSQQFDDIYLHYDNKKVRIGSFISKPEKFINYQIYIDSITQIINGLKSLPYI